MRKFILAGAIVSLSLMSFNSGGNNNLEKDVDEPHGCTGGRNVCAVAKKLSHA